jgi:hypothetical protein
MRAFGKYKSTTTKDRKNIRLHRILVENILGIKLSSEVEIHHVDGNRANNDPSNLVVCPNRSYHQLLHRRQATIDAGFNPDTHHVCTDCKTYKMFSEFSLNKTRASGYNNLCKGCDNKRNKERYKREAYASFD